MTNSKKVLLNAIKKGGSSIRDFRNTSGKKGSFQKEFKVYEREGLSCKRLSVMELYKKKLFQIDLLFFAIFAKYNKLFD